MNDARLNELVRTLRPCRVAVIGDVMLDRYVKGSSDRISPEAPIQVLDVSDEYQMLGGAANVAMKVAELGSHVCAVGLIGMDQSAGDLRALLAGHPAIVDHLLDDSGRCTTVKTRCIARNQQLLRADREVRRAPAGDTLDRLAAAARQAAQEAEAVIMVDYGKGVLCPAVIAAALDGARSAGAPVIVDPNGLDYTRYVGATVLTPNVKEAELGSQRLIVDLPSLDRRGPLPGRADWRRGGGDAWTGWNLAVPPAVCRRQGDAHASADVAGRRARRHGRGRRGRRDAGDRSGLGCRDGRRLRPGQPGRPKRRRSVWGRHDLDRPPAGGVETRVE